MYAVTSLNREAFAETEGVPESFPTPAAARSWFLGFATISDDVRVDSLAGTDNAFAVVAELADEPDELLATLAWVGEPNAMPDYEY